MHNYKELKVWQKSMLVVEEVYRETNNFPKEEIYGITSQIRRSAVSVPSNIAEGAGKNSKKDFKRFLSIAHGSNNELLTLIEITYRLNYLNEKTFIKLENDISEINKMIAGLINSIKI